MNNIAERQNYPENLQLLYAQKQLYIEAKHISNARTALSLLTAFYPFAALLLPVMSKYEWITFMPLLIVSLVFPFFLARFEKNKVQLAASIQEKFDTTVFEMEWNPGSKSKRPLDEQIELAADRFTGDKEKMLDWYSNIPATLSREEAILRCQKANLFWDSEQRSFFMRVYLVVGIIAILVPFVWGNVMNYDMHHFTSRIFIPILPLVQLCFEKYTAHRRLSEKQAKLVQEINEQLGQPVSAHEALLRLHQDIIFENRQELSLVPEKIYDFLRPKLEKTMKSVNEKS